MAQMTDMLENINSINIGNKATLAEGIHCSKKPLSELKPIHLEQMKIGFVQVDHFLACKIVSDAIISNGIEVMIEDTQGQLKNICFDYAQRKESHLFKPGTIALIKEPNYRYAKDSPNLSFIRVESPSDIVFLHKTNRELLEWAGALCWHEPETLSAEELKRRGNAVFSKNNDDALSYYQRALALAIADENCGDLAAVIHLNMAATLLELERYPDVVEHATKAVDGGANKEKAFYRLGCAAYGMRYWQKAIDHFESALVQNPKCKLAAEKLGQAKARLEESLTGKYDLWKLIEEEKNGNRFMNVADYIGPVEIADITGKGKGLIVTEDVVPKGTLLLASKAYAIGFVSSQNNVNMVDKMSVEQRTQRMCWLETIQKLKREPQTAKDLYSLWAGDEFDRQNVPPERIIDTNRIRSIVIMNGFEPMDDRKFLMAEGERLEATGLWIMPSYINHSCLSNTHLSFFGDLMMVRALCDLKKGDELTTSYKPSLDMSFEERNAFFIQRHQFECDCRLCHLERQEAPELRQKRKQMVDEYKKMSQMQWPNPIAALSELALLVKNIRRTYSNRSELRTELVYPLTTLAHIHHMMRLPAMALENYTEMFDTLGPLLMYTMVPTMYMKMMEIYRGTGNLKMAKRTAQKACELLQHKYGTMDKKLFLQMFPKLGLLCEAADLR